MEIIKIMLIIATTMALSITMMTLNRDVDHHEEQGNPSFKSEERSFNEDNELFLPSKRVSRFLAETKNPRAADHCNKDNEICALLSVGGKNTTCCNNKCLDLSEDKHNCGTCKTKCKYTQSCCRGGCVDTNYDKRHCGGCNNRCPLGNYCVYGLCNYA